MLNILIPILLFITSVFLILLVLIQRGRGGGLAGAFGGLGGQSAFGTKAGDLFTRITIGVAAFWIILCAASVLILNNQGGSILNPNMGGSAPGATDSLDSAAAKGAAAADTKAGEETAAPAAGEAAPAEGAAAPASAPAESAPAETPAPATESTEKPE